LWENPKEFCPSRFLVNGQVERPPFFMPFSTGKSTSVRLIKTKIKNFVLWTGRRVCLGDHLAKAEIYLVFASVLQRFHVTIPAGDCAPDCQGVFGMTLKPKAHRLAMTVRREPARPA
jgi:cytochrome P450